MISRQIILQLLLAGSLCACLGPRTTDEPGYSHRLWPEGHKGPKLKDDPRLSATVASGDGLASPMVGLRTAYLDGEPVSYWDFGQATGAASPVWIFRRWDGVDGGTGEPIGHLPLVDTAPGDDGYGPLRAVYLVFVTARYQGEVIPSYEALEDAIELGLVHEPVASGEIVAWPMTRAGAELELPNGDMARPDEVLYRGHRMPCFKLEEYVPPLGPLMLRFGKASAASGYGLRRQNQTQALDESAFGHDLNNDGDDLDSNLIFTTGPDGKGYTGLVEIVDVVVAADYAFGDVTSQDGLFVKTEAGDAAPTDAVIEYTGSGTTYFRPIVP